MRADRALATALADAMLAGPWTQGGLVGRTSEMLGRSPGRPRWVRPLAREILDAHPRPPADRPRELAVAVLATATLQKALTRPRPPQPVIRTVVPTSTVARPFPTPRVDHIQGLADILDLGVDELVSLADTQLRARRAPSTRMAHYRYRWVEKPGGSRLLEAPKARLKAAQRAVLDGLLAPIPVHPAAHGFVPGRSAITGAASHVGAHTVITVDLEHFFATVTAGRIWGALRSAGYPEPVAHLLTGLLTHASPVATLSAMPRGSDRERDFRLRRRLATPHLPQGAPTSPQLANLVAFTLDRRLDAYARAAGAVYTRYADDLTFSGGADLARSASTLLVAVQKIVDTEGSGSTPRRPGHAWPTNGSR